jgi:hypothetical protein
MRSVLTVTLFFCTAHLHAQTPGSVTDTVRCKANANHYYALYLPVENATVKKYPLLLFFDPGGRASVPIRNYHLLAEQYHIIIACSYQSRNGPFQPCIDATYEMLNDIETRFNVDVSSIFLSGFSGGARLATLLAIRDHQFAGVIACGATFPGDLKISKDRAVPYAIIIGDHDMNYLEGVQSTAYLQLIKNPVTKVEFYGDHRWPDPEKFDEAITWQFIKKDLIPDVQTKNYRDKKIRELQIQLDSGNWLTAHDLGIQLTEGFPVSHGDLQTDSILRFIENDVHYLAQKKEQEKLLKLEEEWRMKFYEKYNKAMYLPDSAFHENEWAAVKQEFNKLRFSKDKNKKMTGERLFDFGWRIGAEQSYLLYNQKDYVHAFTNARIWSVFKPDDFYVWYRMATIRAAQNETKEALVYLKKSFDKGFRNKEQIEQDPVFDEVKKLTGYQKLINKF